MKIFKIISINLVLLFLLFLIGEIYCFFDGIKFQNQFVKSKTEIAKNLLSTYTQNINYERYYVPNKKMRSISGKNYKKNPIILFGCSVTYGTGLNEYENFSGVLSELTKRPVYNLANDGWTFSHMLKNLQSNKTLEKLHPDYVIYTFIVDQMRRLYLYQGWPHDTGVYLRFKIDKNDNLVEVKNNFNFLWRSLLVKTIQYKIPDYKILNEKETNKLMLKILQESSNIMKERYPEAKLIMLLYCDYNCKEKNLTLTPNSYFMQEDALKEIENMGFTACTPEYKVDDYHPSAKFWKEFTPKLVQKFKM